jgi:hypothetical protein
MSGKKILAGIFAALILVKLIFILINPGKWMGLTDTLLSHYTIVMVIYLGLLVIIGYVVFTSLDLIDVAVVMLFTSTLLGITLFPYLASMPQLREAIVTQGFGRAWPALIIWGAIATAVLYRVLAGRKVQ